MFPLLLLLADSQSKIFKVLFVCQVDPSKCMMQLVTLPFTVFFSNYPFIGSLAESYSHLLYLRIHLINKSLKIIFRKLFEKYWGKYVNFSQPLLCFHVKYKTLESPLDCKAIQPLPPKGDQSWMFIRGTDVEAETPILWPPDVKD